MVFQIVTPTLSISVMIALGIMYGLAACKHSYPAAPYQPNRHNDSESDEFVEFSESHVGNFATKTYFAIAEIAAIFAIVPMFS